MNPTIELPAAELKTALTGLGKVISRHRTLPILGHVRVTRTDHGVVTLQATDLDVSACYQAEATAAGEPCDLLVPYEPFNKLVKGGKEPVQLTVEAKDKVRLKTFIGSSPMEQTLTTLPVDEFPPTVCLDPRSSDGHYIAGTDGRHLYAANSFHFDFKAPVLIPDRAFLRWNKFLESGTGLLTVPPATKNELPWLKLESGPWTLLAKSTDAEFPNWKQAVPASDSSLTALRLAANAVATLLAGVPKLPGGDEYNRPVQLEIKAGRFTVLARAKDAPDWTRLVIEGATITGKDITLGVNRDYLLKALRFGLTTAEFIDDLSPMVFSEGGRRLVVMPLRPDGAVP
ncbi:MAG: hypothetical protein EBS05_27525, partial [Proteobacteria bacterium]|nr:hypothetical protein [Pseudomonadota bacterium]